MNKKLVKIQTKKYGTLTATLTCELQISLRATKDSCEPRKITIYAAKCKVKGSEYTSCETTAVEAIKNLTNAINNTDNQYESVNAQYAVPPTKPVIKRR